MGHRVRGPSRGTYHAAVAAVAAAITCHAPAALAQDARLHLVWHAPAGCPDENAVRAAVATLLEHTPEAAHGAALTARAEVEPAAAGGFTLHLSTEGGGADGERRVDAADCAQAADAAALVIALALAPDGFAPAATNPSATNPSANPPANSPAASPAPATAPTDANRPVTDVGFLPPRRARTQFGARVYGALDLGTVPAAAPTLGAMLHATRGAFRVEIGGEYVSAQSGTFANGTVGPPISWVRVWVAAAQVRACTTIQLAYGALSFCAAVDGGVMHAEAVGLGTAADGPFIALLGPMMASARVTPWLAFGAEATPGITLVAPRFWALDPPSTVFRPSPIVFRTGIFAEVYF